MLLRTIFFLLFYVVIDYYAFQSIRAITRNQWIYWLYVLVSALVLANCIYQFFWGATHRDFTAARGYAIGFLLSMLVPKLILVVFMFGEDLIRIPQAMYSYFGEGQREKLFFPQRRRFLSQIALGVAALPFAGLLYGMFQGKYNYKVLKYQLSFPDLPDAFDGYTITQISDIHSGSFDNYKKTAYGVDLINKQNSDLILFTGDMVNNKASEMENWEELFGQLKAPAGVFSVLGNHDYGDYTRWESPEAKAQNLEALKALQKRMGFKLLLNESIFIEKKGQRMALIGVENWGAGWFKKAGDLNAAIKNVKPDDFKILMSHDPSHWEEEVISHEDHFHLTLSGHTHGMQFGIEIPGLIKWSPVRWRYKYWAGLYKEKGQFINVNRGFGFIGYSGRVGIWPEITVIELKKGKKNDGRT